jgi:Uma2 family endonuclease
MIAVGILRESDRVELLGGEIRHMPPIDPTHAAIESWGSDLLRSLLPPSLRLRGQNPVHLSDDSEPEPDLVVVRFRDDYYQHRHPTPADILLIIDISDPTLDLDHADKLPRYAGALIPETWIIAVASSRIEQHVDPSAALGQYRTRRIFGRGEVITAAAIPSLSVSVDALLGPAGHAS